MAREEVALVRTEGERTRRESPLGLFWRAGNRTNTNTNAEVLFDPWYVRDPFKDPSVVLHPIGSGGWSYRYGPDVDLSHTRTSTGDLNPGPQWSVTKTDPDR